ncbi:MAG: polysaccharide biosynthesis/export family protein [Parvibaculum sp.]|nr:polysaccharide biosynthesis/export family protein [Parvibaculum sp.]
MQLFGGFKRGVVAVGFLIIALTGLSACAGGDQSNSSVVLTAQAQVAVATVDQSSLSYRLGAGDKLRVGVFGEPDLSGEFDVPGNGNVSLPLIGQVKASGLTLSEFEGEIREKLQEGYLTNPKVTVEVLNYRPFYIIGEVGKPGEYPYTDGMTVLNAVAVAGGFTYRANDSQVYITRNGGEEAAYQVGQSIRVLPGDIVRVPERFF